MDREKIEKLLDAADDGDKMALTALYNGCVGALKQYQGDHAKGSLADWQASEKALGDLVGVLEQKYFPQEPVLENVLALVNFLSEQGYKISKSKAYNDAKSGLLSVRDDKTIFESEAWSYAARAGLERVVPGTSASAEGMQAKKLSAELSLAEAREEKLRFELDKDRGKYMLKTDVAVENATRIGFIEAGVKHLMRTRGADYITIVGGDGKKLTELCENFFADVDSLFNQFCNARALIGEIDLDDE